MQPCQPWRSIIKLAIYNKVRPGRPNPDKIFDNYDKYGNYGEHIK